MAEPAPIDPYLFELPEQVEAGPLVLREYDEGDAAALVDAVTANLEHLRPWMPWIEHEPMSVADRVLLIRTWHADRQAGRGTVYGMFLDGELVGGTGFHPRIGPGGLELGYWVARSHVGRGFATIAARALTDRAFTFEGLERVQIRHDVANVASEAVPRRLGYRHVRDEPRPPQAPGETGVLRIWETTRAEWPPASA